MLAPGDLAQIVYDMTPIWTSDVDLDHPIEYLPFGQVVLLIKASENSESNFWLVVFSSKIGFVYESNIRILSKRSLRIKNNIKSIK